MGTPEFHELHEHAEHGAHDPSMAPVSLTMAILAVALAIVSLLGHRAHTEETILQNKTSDQWAYYQAKNIRMHEDEIEADRDSIIVATDTQKAAQLRDKYKTEADRYRTDKADIQSEAQKLANETDQAGRRGDRFDLGEVFLEIALVVTSITLLTRRRLFWYSGLIFSAMGVVAALTSLMVR
jgi:Flp pilus assembly protein TadB